MKCQICHCKIEYSGRGRPPKYCDSCAYLVQLDQMRLSNFFRRIGKKQLGTNNFDEHRRENFKIEHMLILKQIKKLGFKRQFT